MVGKLPARCIAIIPATPSENSQWLDPILLFDITGRWDRSAGSVTDIPNTSFLHIAFDVPPAIAICQTRA